MTFNLEAATETLPDDPPTWAVVPPGDPRHRKWAELIGSDAVPIGSAGAHAVRSIGGNLVIVVFLDPHRLDGDQKIRIAARYAEKSGATLPEVMADLQRGLLPIDAHGMMICTDPDVGRENLGKLIRQRQGRLSKGG